MTEQIISDNYHLIITNNETKETRICAMDIPFLAGSLWWLTEGNYGCDCNRRIEFYRVEFPKLIYDDYECTGGKFTIVAAILSNGSIMPIDEPYRNIEDFKYWLCINPEEENPIFQFTMTSIYYDTDSKCFLEDIYDEIGENNEVR